MTLRLASYHHKKPVLLLVFSVLLCVVWLASSRAAHAISNISPESGTSTVNGNSAQPWYAVGVGLFNGTDSYLKVYVRHGQGATVTIHQGCGVDVGSPSVVYTVFTLAADESFSGAGGGAPVTSAFSWSGCNPTLSMTIPAGRGIKSNIQGHELYDVYYFNAQIQNPTGTGDNERSFRVSVSGSNLVGISRVVRGSGSAAVFGIYQRDAQAYGGQEWSYNQKFAPRCSDPNRDYPIGIYDADTSTYNPNIGLVLDQNKNRGTSGWSFLKQFPPPPLGNNHDYVTLLFPAVNTSIYRMRWSNINWRNTLQINVPFDEFDTQLSTVNCNPSLPVDRSTCVQNSVMNVLPGQLVYPTIIFNNTYVPDPPSTTWTNAYHVRRLDALPPGGAAPGGSTDTSPPLIDSTTTPPPITPGNNANFTFGVRGYTAGATYVFRYRVANASDIQFGGICTITLNVSNAAAACAIDKPSGNVNFGQPFSFNVQAYNGTGADWTGHTNAVSIPRQWAVYLTMNNPSPYAGYIQKYEAHLGPPLYHDGTQGTLSTGQTSNPSTIGVNTNIVGPQTFNFYLVRLVSPAPSFVYLAPRNFDGLPHCSITINVVQPVYQTGGSITAATCKAITGSISNPAGVPAGFLQIVRISDRAVMGNVGVGAWDATGAKNNFSKDPFLNWSNTLLTENYEVSLYGFNSAGNFQPTPLSTVNLNGGSPCLSDYCVSASAMDFEPGETKNVTNLGGFGITNYSNRPDSFSIRTTVTGLTVAYPNPYTFAGTSGNHLVIPTGQATSTGALITISRTLSYRGSPIDSCSDSPSTPRTRPYLKVFGGDVSAGGWFNKGNQSCATGPVQQVGSGGIRTFASAYVSGSHPYRAGASSELAAFALGPIDSNNASKYGFYTWGLGSGARPPNTIITMNPLDFANTSPTDGLLGFSSGGTDTATEGCIKDYYSNASASGGTVRPGNLNGKPASGGTSSSIYRTNGSLSINGTWNFNPGERLTIYVPGDVYINTDIKYTGSGANPAVGSIINPSYFSLIVQGNIYIASNVHVLEGLYIAQPDPADPATFSKKGNIWTCAVPSGGGTLRAPNLAEISASCGGPNNKLTINGAVIAKHVTFNRVGDTNNTLSLVKSTDPETSTVIPGGTNKSVEEINYIPEMVIGSPYFSVTGSNSRFDVVTILPPLF